MGRGGVRRGSVRLSLALDASGQERVALASVIGPPITGNTDYDRAAVKAPYRFLESDPAVAVTPENLWVPHRARTIERMRSQQVGLCIQEGSRWRYDPRPAGPDLSVMGRNQTPIPTRGMHVHTTWATTSDGLPLGVWRGRYRDPDGGPLRPKAPRGREAYLDLGAAADQISRPIRVIRVLDREGDRLVLYDAHRRHPRVERARADRLLQKGGGSCWRPWQRIRPPARGESRSSRGPRVRSRRARRCGRVGVIAWLGPKYGFAG